MKKFKIKIKYAYIPLKINGKYIWFKPYSQTYVWTKYLKSINICLSIRKGTYDVNDIYDYKWVKNSKHLINE